MFEKKKSYVVNYYSHVFTMYLDIVISKCIVETVNLEKKSKISYNLERREYY